MLKLQEVTNALPRGLQSIGDISCLMPTATRRESMCVWTMKPGEACWVVRIEIS